MRFLWHGQQGTSRDATGHMGFCYHFLDTGTAARAWKCELSTMDTALLLAGILMAAAYFDGTSRPDREIRVLAADLYAGVNWTRAPEGGQPVPPRARDGHPSAGSSGVGGRATQMSYCGVDGRGIQNPFIRSHGIDYFENSRRATRVDDRELSVGPDLASDARLAPLATVLRRVAFTGGWLSPKSPRHEN